SLPNWCLTRPFICSQMPASIASTSFAPKILRPRRNPRVPACMERAAGLLFRRLDELQREAVALADRRVLVAVLVAEAIARRERPDTPVLNPGLLSFGVEPPARLE